MAAEFSVEREIVPLKTIREVKPNTFIFERPGALAADFCDEVVRRFEASPHYHRKGVIGQLYLAVMIARLVGLHIAGQSMSRD